MIRFMTKCLVQPNFSKDPVKDNSTTIKSDKQFNKISFKDHFEQKK